MSKKKQPNVVTHPELIKELQRHLDPVPDFILKLITQPEYTESDLEDLENTLDYMQGKMNDAKEALRSFIISQG